MYKNKAGILTFQNADNYGAILQCYATYKHLSDLGLDCEVINYDNGVFDWQYSQNPFKKKLLKTKIHYILFWMFKFKRTHQRVVMHRKLQNFLQNNTKLSEYCDKNSIRDIASKYDYVISGSDQVWNPSLTEYDMNYFLPFAGKNSKKISLASSIGNIKYWDHEFKEKVINELKTFDYISVREDDAAEFLKDNKLNAESIFDPTFMLTKDEWSHIAADISKKYPNGYVFMYVMAPYNDLYKVASEYAKAHNLPLITMGNIHERDVRTIYDAGIEEFLGYIKHSSMFFTTSFHGIALASNMNVPFFYELDIAKKNVNSRILSLTNKLNIEDREIHKAKSYDATMDLKNINTNISLYRNQINIFINKWKNDTGKV